MTITKITSGFNRQTVLLLLGIMALIVGIWLQWGMSFGLMAVGLAFISIALMLNYNEGR